MDFMSYLFEAYKNANLPNNTADEFISFAKDFLQENPPVGYDYMSKGLGITLKNGERLQFVDDKDSADNFQMFQPGIPITNIKY